MFKISLEKLNNSLNFFSIYLQIYEHIKSSELYLFCFIAFKEGVID